MQENWGKWIIERAEACDIRTQVHLAHLIGMAPSNLSKLLSHDKPPRMRRSTSASLANVLETTEDIIRMGWKRIEPGAVLEHLAAREYERRAPLDDEMLVLKPISQRDDEEASVRREVEGIARALPPILLRKLRDAARQLMTEHLESTKPEHGFRARIIPRAMSKRVAKKHRRKKS